MALWPVGCNSFTLFRSWIHWFIEWTLLGVKYEQEMLWKLNWLLEEKLNEIFSWICEKPFPSFLLLEPQIVTEYCQRCESRKQLFESHMNKTWPKPKKQKPDNFERVNRKKPFGTRELTLVLTDINHFERKTSVYYPQQCF